VQIRPMNSLLVLGVCSLISLAGTGCRQASQEKLQEQRVAELEKLMNSRHSVKDVVRILRKYSVDGQDSSWKDVAVRPDDFGKDIVLYAYIHDFENPRVAEHFSKEALAVVARGRERITPLTVRADRLSYERKGRFGLVTASGNVVLWPVDAGWEYKCDLAVVWHFDDKVKTLYTENSVATFYLLTYDEEGNIVRKIPGLEDRVMASSLQNFDYGGTITGVAK
jgi:hypothetical protein